MTLPVVGQTVTDFSAAMTSDQTFRLSDYQGQKNIVLYFYPKDSMPGCTTEGQDFRDSYAEFQALDTETGQLLWSTRLPAPAHGYPITYTADGKQYVAIPAGIGVFRALTAVIFPDIYQPPDGQGLFVFSLPE